MKGLMNRKLLFVLGPITALVMFVGGGEDGVGAS